MQGQPKVHWLYRCPLAPARSPLNQSTTTKIPPDIGVHQHQCSPFKPITIRAPREAPYGASSSYPFKRPSQKSRQITLHKVEKYKVEKAPLRNIWNATNVKFTIDSPSGEANFKPSMWFDFLQIVNAPRGGAVAENQNAVFYRNSDPWKCDPWKCWESKCSFLEKFWPVKLPLSLFLALSWNLTWTTKLATNLNLGIVICQMYYVANLNSWQQKWLSTLVWHALIGRVCFGPRMRKFGSRKVQIPAQLASDWWPRLFNAPQRGDCLKGVLSHKFLPASKTLHKAGTIRWNCISNFLPSS